MACIGCRGCLQGGSRAAAEGVSKAGGGWRDRAGEAGEEDGEARSRLDLGDRVPVKQGKKMARQSVNSYLHNIPCNRRHILYLARPSVSSHPGAKEGPQLARRFAVERPVGAGPVALAGASIGSRFGAPKRER